MISPKIPKRIFFYGGKCYITGLSTSLGVVVERYITFAVSSLFAINQLPILYLSWVIVLNSLLPIKLG